MSQIEGLQFEEEGHRYIYKRKRILSVTQVLTLAGYRQVPPDPPSPSFILARNIGTAVHEATRLLDEGKLDPSTVDPRISGYVEAWKKFKEDSKATIEEIEQNVLVHHGSLCAGGRFDRMAKIGRSQRTSIIDIKTGAQVPPDTGLQLAAYAIVPSLDRFGIHLQYNSTYKVYAYENSIDFELFRAAMVTAYGQIRLGISKIEDTF